VVTTGAISQIIIANKPTADFLRAGCPSPGIYPDPQGGYNPQISCDTPPNHLKFKGGYQGGVYGGVFM